MGFYRGPETINRNLLFYLDAANHKSYPGSGTATTNLAYNGNNGVLTNGVGFNSANGGYFTFDGNDDYIEYGSIDSSNPMSLSQFETQNNFTIETWVYIRNTGDPYQRIIDKSNGGSSANGWSLFVNHNVASTKRLNFGVNGNSPIQYYGSDAYQYDAWNHIVITKGSTYGWTYKAYNNGNLLTTNTGQSVQFPTTTTNMRIGSWNHTTARELNGNLAYIKAYAATLSDEEVLQNYNATKGRFGL